VDAPSSPGHVVLLNHGRAPAPSGRGLPGHLGYERIERKLAAILVTDMVGYSRLASVDEDRTLARLRTLRSDLLDPTISAHRGRTVKRTGDGSVVEFRSVVDAVRCSIELQNGLAERNVGLPPERRIEFRVGIHLGDVVEESDGDLMGDGVNIAARLEGLAEPGGICLSEDAYHQVRDRIQEECVDLGDRTLRNIARPVRIYALKSRSGGAASAPRVTARENQTPPHLSIVVLPFVNLDGDPRHEYFADGVTENLTTDLSRITGSFVIGRHTAFTYKGKAFSLKQIGRDLNVRYALEGSVQRSGKQMRVNAQLVDAESGSHLWAERFDKPVASLFEMQDDIVARLANTLNAQLVAAEARRAERVPHPDSMDLYFQGLAWLNKGLTPEFTAQALGLFEHALMLDPENVDALVRRALTISIAASTSFAEDRAARFAAAEASLVKALSLAPEHAWAHLAMGYVLGVSNRPERGIASGERALALDRNLAGAHTLIGLNKSLIGRGDETEAHVQEALRLSPRDAWAYAWLSIVGFAKNFLGRHDEAIVWLQRSIDCNRNNPMCHFHLAGALARLDRLEEAQAAVKAGLTLNPHFTIAGFRVAAWSDNPAYLFQRERLINGLREAGVPEK
jgi:TolB-like protein/class 3 adenylate cyclase